MSVWPKVALGDICKPRQWPIIAKKDFSESGYPVYGAGGIIGHSIKKTHDSDVVLIGCRGTCGNVIIAPGPLYASGNAMALDAVDDTVDPAYLAIALEYRGLRDIITGSSQPQITRTNLTKVRIPMPPLAQQRHITNVLRSSSTLHNRNNALTKEIDSWGDALFIHYVASDKNSQLNPIGELGSISTGKTPPTSNPRNFGSHVPFITPGDLNSGRRAERYLSIQGQRLSRTAPQGSALVCCIGATTGKVDLAREDCAFNQQINAVTWGESIHPQYGYHALRAIAGIIRRSATSTTLPILNKTSFACLSIPVVPYESQLNFVERIERSQTIRERLITRRELSRELHASLQHRAFRGEL